MTFTVTTFRISIILNSDYAFDEHIFMAWQSDTE